jgi:hypothetical protein
MAKVGKIRVDQLEVTVAGVLSDFLYVSDESVKLAAEDAAEELAGDVRAKAPARTGAYKSQIDSRGEGGYGRGKHGAQVYINGDRYRLGHLLEKGHRKGGWAARGHASRKGGRVPPSPPGGHWKPAADRAPEVLVRKIKERLS